MLEHILTGFTNSMMPFNFLLIIVGLTGGIVIGALPGLTATMGVALMVPITFAMNPISGLVMLGAIYSGAIYGGSNSAILINTPGTPSSVATTFDGWPMTQKGDAEGALNASLLASAFGGVIGTLFLLFLAAPMAQLALKFGAPEFFWLCIFGLSTIASMSQGNVVKGLISGALGMLVSTIGLDPLEGLPRFTFGSYSLVQGIEVIPAMIGLFSFSQVITLVGSKNKFIAEYKGKRGATLRVAKKLWKDAKANLLRSSIIGSFVGILPGAGGEIASIISYNEAKRWDKNKANFGKGIIEGVAASESANNATIGGSLIPMLTLGIPGSAVAAVIMGALLAHGIQPGFKIFTNNAELAYTFIVSLIVVNIVMVFVGAFLIKGTARVLNVPTSYIGVAIVSLSIIGSYAIRNSMIDVMVMIFFGLVGYFGGKIGFDTGAMALGIILGPIVEDNLSRSISIAGAEGSVLKVFFTHPIALLLIILTIVSVMTPMFLTKHRSKKEAVVNDEA
ncbi:tripartite tricarboxylate transporter permease [Desulfosporosinus shakirovi]|uniref:tripartite tricarboxylate transporter permease n=1 Tax=Desulfosporosinus shakirovi TaxID=2885154 RepID=UPI001E538798|nr:tripartite tricarboxylate transporter permease [Desulfosporosinus sp. SRJS8]MCB8814212.1 tripartite tricarboxylate transporter permease [Desulfosporosinus sp. SRJS8]